MRVAFFSIALLTAIAVPGVSEAAVRLDFDYVANLSLPQGGTGDIAVLGAGAGIELMAGSHLGFRLGADVLERAINSGTWWLAEVPLELRFYPIRWFYLAAGAYTDLAFSPPAALGAKTVGLGVVGGAGFRVPLTPRLHLMLGANYDYCFTNIAAKGTVYPHQLLSYAGLSLSFGGTGAARGGR